MDYLNVPAELLDRPIEPWRPKVGDRVRVRLNGECRVTFTAYGANDLIPRYSRHDGHHIAEDGQHGTVQLWPSPIASCASHPYFVRFDSPIPMDDSDGRLHGSIYAACELEALTDEGR
jgi:hypothetical protein